MAGKSATTALYVALGFLALDVSPAAMPPGLRALHAWLDIRGDRAAFSPVAHSTQSDENAEKQRVVKGGGPKREAIPSEHSRSLAILGPHKHVAATDHDERRTLASVDERPPAEVAPSVDPRNAT